MIQGVSEYLLYYKKKEKYSVNISRWNFNFRDVRRFLIFFLFCIFNTFSKFVIRILRHPIQYINRHVITNYFPRFRSLVLGGQYLCAMQEWIEMKVPGREIH